MGKHIGQNPIAIPIDPVNVHMRSRQIFSAVSHMPGLVADCATDCTAVCILVLLSSSCSKLYKPSVNTSRILVSVF